MELSDEQIDAAITAGVQSGAISWVGFKKDGDGRYTLPAISDSNRQCARAIETEVRKQDDALIRQLVEALESVDDAMPFPVARQVLKVARARMSPPTAEQRA